MRRAFISPCTLEALLRKEYSYHNSIHNNLFQGLYSCNTLPGSLYNVFQMVNLHPSKLKRKRILRSSKATVVIDEPVYTKDKSRYFKEQWEQERKRLFFR